MRNNGELQYRMTYDGLLSNQNKQNVTPLDYFNLTEGRPLHTTRNNSNHNKGMILSATSHDYKELLKKTVRDHDNQIEKKATYQMNPDCRNNLWNMIDAYKKEREIAKDN